MHAVQTFEALQCALLCVYTIDCIGSLVDMHCTISPSYWSLKLVLSYSLHLVV